MGMRWTVSVPLRLLPLSSRLSGRGQVALGLVAAFTLATLALNVGSNALGVGGDLETLLNRWGQNAVMAGAVALCAMRSRLAGRDRPAWIALTAALLCWTLGNLYWNGVLYEAAAPPYPSPADAGWLLFYPAACVCVGRLLRSEARALPATMWLDGLVGALTVAAVVVAFVLAPLLDFAAGTRAAVLTNAAYPIGDLLLVCLAVAVLGLHSWRAGRGWILLSLGFATFAAADLIYLHRLASGSYVPGTVLDSLWQVGAVAMAIAAWQRPAHASARLDGLRSLLVPFGFGLGATALLLGGHLLDLAPAAAAFAAAALVASMLRTALTVRELRGLFESRRQAATDDLTGLPNRRWFDRRLREAITAAGREGRELAVLVIDLDHFKWLNDTLGHHAGDRVLAELGPRLRTALREGDGLARLGGDEFAAVLQDAGSAAGAAARIAAVLEARVSVEGIDLQVAASIGVALYPEHGTDAVTLLRRADVAMYEAKARRTGLEFYVRERDGNTRERLQMIGELRIAIAERRLVLHYQPMLDLRTGAVASVEALVRWPHPERGLVPPGDFVPLAERTGLIGPLTRFVLDEALRQAAAWRAEGLRMPVAVNVSATNLLAAGWTEEVLAALERHGLAPESLALELTEGVLMADPERSREVFTALAAAGVRVSLDDFGTGYSSLADLRRLPVHELKIDRTFVRDVLNDPADAAVVRTLVDLAGHLGLDIVAEGVEDAETLALLRGFGADRAQGFHIARPQPADELTAWLRARPVRDDEHHEGARPVDALHPV